MSKKPMHEDAFYENLTMGLMKTLCSIPRVSNVYCEKRQPCEKAHVINWEQRHCVYLPEDMKKFYLSTDGFLLQWSYQYAPNDIRRVGHIHVPHLLQVTLLRENIEPIYPPPPAEQPNGTQQSPAPPKDQWGNPMPVITPKTKIFELNVINEVAKVCLIYDSTSTSNPKLYLLELETFKWVFLADTFSEYLRMAIAHLGLPFWELCFSSFGLPSWTEQLFLLLEPHLLEEHEPRRGRAVEPGSEHPYNHIDPSVFRAKPKPSGKMTGKHIKRIE